MYTHMIQHVQYSNMLVSDLSTNLWLAGHSPGDRSDRIESWGQHIIRRNIHS